MHLHLQESSQQHAAHFQYHYRIINIKLKERRARGRLFLFGEIAAVGGSLRKEF